MYTVRKHPLPMPECIFLLGIRRDIASYVNEINAYMGKTWLPRLLPRVICEEFEATRTKMIEELQKNYVDEVFQYFYDEAVAQADDVAAGSDEQRHQSRQGTVKFILPRQESVYCKMHGLL